MELSSHFPRALGPFNVPVQSPEPRQQRKLDAVEQVQQLPAHLQGSLGGLAGLKLADHLERSGSDYRLVEARERLGGRIYSVAASAVLGRDERYDLGPAWFWPGQPLMAGLARDLGLKVFEQYSAGRLVLQEANGSVRRDIEYSAMAGSLRLAGGMMSVIDGLRARVSASRVLTGHTVVELTLTTRGGFTCLGLRQTGSSSLFYSNESNEAETNRISSLLTGSTWRGFQRRASRNELSRHPISIRLYPTPLLRPSHSSLL